eukprot:GHVS01052495.1.p3 GENE.GHVS01052495.1~~GHVS01052495.1.p3  ORF type:complete len:142 (+),score=14.97 GHVS01052495.1:157-582(+)
MPDESFDCLRSPAGSVSFCRSNEGGLDAEAACLPGCDVKLLLLPAIQVALNNEPKRFGFAAFFVTIDQYPPLGDWRTLRVLGARTTSMWVVHWVHGNATHYGPPPPPPLGPGLSKNLFSLLQIRQLSDTRPTIQGKVANLS